MKNQRCEGEVDCWGHNMKKAQALMEFQGLRFVASL